MSIALLSPRNTAHAVLLALETAEGNLMPEGCYSRLSIASAVADSTVAFYAHPSLPAKQRLFERIELLREVEWIAATLGQLPEGSLMQRGISLALHVGSAALADADPNAPFVLEEARRIVRLSEGNLT